MDLSLHLRCQGLDSQKPATQSDSMQVVCALSKHGAFAYNRPEAAHGRCCRARALLKLLPRVAPQAGNTRAMHLRAETSSTLPSTRSRNRQVVHSSYFWWSRTWIARTPAPSCAAHGRSQTESPGQMHAQALSSILTKPNFKHGVQHSHDYTAQQ